MTIRTLFVRGLVPVFAAWDAPAKELGAAGTRYPWWLGLSGVTTASSWIPHHEALKAGNVATVALIDKGSAVLAMLPAWLLPQEVTTLRMLAGAASIVASLTAIAEK